MSVLKYQMSLKELFKDFAPILDIYDQVVKGLTIDSRKVKSGFVHFALSGISSHGLYYIDDVLSSKACAVVVEFDDRKLNDTIRKQAAQANCCIIEITGLAKKIGHIAARYYQNDSNTLNVVGVTGTDGKTSVAQFAAIAMQSCGYESGVIGTNGWGRPGKLNKTSLTTPDPIEAHRQLSELRNSGVRYVFMEVSSHALEQSRVQGIQFNIAVFTNIARDHLDYHGTVEKYAEAKKSLFVIPGLSAAVINADDKLGEELISSLKSDMRVIGYSIIKPSDFQAKNICVGRDGLYFEVERGNKIIQLRSTLLGLFNVYNFLAVYAVLSEVGLKEKEIINALESLTAVPGRIEKFSGTGFPMVVVDFAHTPQALEAVLKSLRMTQCEKIWCVFGCGGDRDKGKRVLMGEIASSYSDEIIITSDNPRTEDPNQIASEIYEGTKKETSTRIVLNRYNAIETAINSASTDDCVLIAGKGHEDHQILGTNYQPFSDRDVVKKLLRTHVS